MKKLTCLFLSLLLVLSCLPAAFADDTGEAADAISSPVESFDFCESFTGGVGFDSINSHEGLSAFKAYGTKISISRTDMNVQTALSGNLPKYAEYYLYTEQPEKLDLSSCSMTVVINGIKKTVKPSEKTTLVSGWNCINTMLLGDLNGTVSEIHFEISSVDETPVSIMLDDFCFVKYNKITDSDAFKDIFEKAAAFYTADMSESDASRFEFFKTEQVATQHGLENAAKELTALMNKYENLAEQDKVLSANNISSKDILVRGRAFYDENGLRMGYGACGFTVRFYGTTLTGDFSFIGAMATDGGNSHYNVYVDTDDYCYDFDTSLPFPECRDKYNETTPYFTINRGSVNKITLCGKDEGVITGLTEGIHTVTVLKRGEGGGRTSNGLLTNLSTDGKFLAPPKENTRRIEVIGDSDAAAFGNLSIGTNLPWDPETQDTTLSYAARAADHFGAAVSVTAKSGVCLLKSPKANEGYYTDNYFFTDNWSVGDKYRYDFASNPADAVFISLGGNDYGRIQPTDAEFTDGMANFIRQVRSVNPDSAILVSGGRATEAINRIKAEGDTNVYSFTIGLSPRSGASGHPSMTAHIEGAQRFESTLSGILGWNTKQHEIFSSPLTENGSFEFSADYNEAGTKTYITPSAAEGYTLKEGTISAKTVKGETVEVQKDEQGYFITCPDAMVVVTGEFEQKAGVMGDVDGDGKVTTTDALHILQHFVGSREFNEQQLALADFNGDKIVDISDALSALLIAVGYAPEDVIKS